MKKYRLSFFALLLFAASSPAAELRFTGPELAGFIQNAFNGTVIRLNADSPAVPGKPAIRGSFVQLGPLLGRQRFLFSVPSQTIELGLGGEAVFSINDINSNPDFVQHLSTGLVRFGQNIRVTASPNSFTVMVRFEDEGTEIKGEPAGRLRRLRGEAVPDIEISAMLLQIALTPQQQGIAFQPSQVTFLGDIQAQGFANIQLFGRKVDLFDAMTDYKKIIKGSIEGEVKHLVDQNLPVIAANLSREAQRRAAALGVRITGARFEGTMLVVAGSPSL
ncbi:MAG TPA: hypothetical protein VHL58_16705 [Thermoanaerobaculia bacterium]|nr:hypothetical protein [Thermoanaerobaculia bacterium]